jgi:2'-5' RNA ligase
MRYLVAIMVPEPYRTRLRQLQAQHGPKRWHLTLDPHITLLPPSEAHLEPAAAVRAFEALAPTLSLQITAQQLGRFDHPDSHVLYLAAEPVHQLRDLSQHLYQAAIWQDVQPRPWPGFTPHITLANMLHDSEVESCWQALQQLSFHDITFSVSGVTLLGRESGQAQWQVLATSDTSSTESTG